MNSTTSPASQVTTSGLTSVSSTSTTGNFTRSTVVASTVLQSTSSASFSTLISSTIPNNVTGSNESLCLKILYEDVGSSRLRIWDVVLFIPNLLFLIFLIYQFYKSRSRVYRGLAGSTPIFSAYLLLVSLSALFSVIRCIVSMTVDLATTAGSDANKILWILLRFVLLMAEMSVLVFGLACGHLDSQASIRRVLVITFLLALLYSVTQGVLEILVPHHAFEIDDDTRSVYSHGGPMFSFITSVIFCTIYLFVDLLPFCGCMKQYFTIPTKKIFYVYVTVMAILYFFFALGSELVNTDHTAGLCILDIASLMYFILFAPLLYGTFLRSYLGNIQQNSIPFSYSNQIDEALEEHHDTAGHSSHNDVDFNGVLVFDRLPLTNYDGDKRGTDEPMRDLAGETNADDSRSDDHSTVNFFKEIDLADNNDEFDYR